MADTEKKVTEETEARKPATKRTTGKGGRKTTAKPKENKAKKIDVPANEIQAVDEDGNETPLTELAPELEDEVVEVEIENEKEMTLEEAMKRLKEVEALLDKQQNPAQTGAAPVMMLTPEEPKVKILYMDAVDITNQIPIGNGKIITGPGKVFTVPMSYFEGEFQNPFRMRLLQNRKFIVLDGLTQEQREQYGVDYKKGEIIKNLGMFDFLLGCPTAKAVEVFEALCKSHREMVGARFNGAYEKGDNRITRDKIEALNAISKQDYADGKGAFSNILEAMNEKSI